VESVSLLPVIADLAGAAIARRLAGENYEVLVANRDVLDLSDQRATENWLERARPDANFLAAGLVGGINANNNYPAASSQTTLRSPLTSSVPLIRLA
jgi:nucleoside-diphosphate-sugar epimerase